MTMPPAALLRSVNLRLDLQTPERFQHFRPTPKSARVIRAILFGQPSAATTVTAAYGSGKSLAAGFACLLLERAAAGAVCAQILSRLRSVDPALANDVQDLRGLAVILEGAQADLPEAIRASASAALGVDVPRPGRQGVIAVLDAVAEAARARDLPRVALVWDEFGRHLESLAAEGRAHDLAQVQQTAEWAARQDAATFTLLMHQGFFHYTGGLSQSARTAWRKVEGRFGAIQFVDDSREMHRLIAEAIEAVRPSAPHGLDFRPAAEAALRAGLFPAFDTVDDLADTLAAAWPLDPAALHVLPTLSARVAQHERSMFAFIMDADLSRRVCLKAVYDQFAPALEADVGIGGTHRRWLETESALSKTHGPEEARAVAAVALLGLGAGGQRLRVSRQMLLTAVAPWGDDGTAEAAVQALLARKLLLYRERTDDLSVWHGTDLDLRSRLEDERTRIEAAFDLISFLAERRPPPVARPVAHNLNCWIRRSWTGAYVAASDLLAAGRAHPLLVLQPGEDGRVLYVLTEGPTDAASALLELLPGDGAVIACLPDEPLPLRDLALEVECLRRLGEDETLIGSDPLAESEIAHMAAAAAETLERALERAVMPGKGRQLWFGCGSRLIIHDDASLAERLSEIADRRFAQTPIVRNELVVKRRLSRQMVNARKKVLLGILERDGQPHLGFEWNATTPDTAIYRTVIARTGLYHQEPDGAWGWAAPFQIRDAGLRAVWQVLQTFFASPGRKPFAQLHATLLLPPFGLREGLLPILAGAGLKAFGRAVALRKSGAWVPDVLASEIEDMCARPDLYEIEVFDLDGGLGDYLRGLAEEFGRPAPAEADLLRHAQDALAAWTAQLPANALAPSPRSDPAVRRFQLALAPGHDPADVLLRRLPQAAGMAEPGAETLILVGRCRKALEGVVEGYQAEAVQAVRATFSVSGGDGDALQSAKAWADCFTGLNASCADRTAQAVLARAAAAGDGRYTEASFARALSILLVGLDFDKWTDRTPVEFARKLKAAAAQVEEAALAATVPDPAVRPVLEDRVGDLLAKLVRLGGRRVAEQLLEKVVRQEGEIVDGDT